MAKKDREQCRADVFNVLAQHGIPLTLERLADEISEDITDHQIEFYPEEVDTLGWLVGCLRRVVADLKRIEGEGGNHT